jgi:hemoglobin-like flavoprotein
MGCGQMSYSKDVETSYLNMGNTTMSDNISSLQLTILNLLTVEDEFVPRFYNNLFNMYPPARSLFVHTEISLQYNKFRLMLMMIVRTIHDADSLKIQLQQLGQRHKYYRVEPEHFAILYIVFVQTVVEYIGPKWTTELEATWAKAYGSIVRMMDMEPLP